jgi:hypothetical protein
MSLSLQSVCANDPCQCKQNLPAGGPWPTTAPDTAVQVGVYAIQIGLNPDTGLPNPGGGGNTLIGMGGFSIGDPTYPYVHFPTPLVWDWGPTPLNSSYLDGVYYYVFLRYRASTYYVGDGGGPDGSGTGRGEYMSLTDAVNAALQFQTYWWG